MALHSVQDVIHKAVVDEGFRSLLLNNPSEALVGYDLTDEEHRSLSRLDASLFEGEQATLEDRLSRGIQLN